MTVRKRRGGQYYFRKWVRLPTGVKVRLFGVPGTFGLPNTKVGAEEALRRAVNDALAGLPLKPQPVAPAKVEAPATIKSLSATFINVSEVDNKDSSVRSK